MPGLDNWLAINIKLGQNNNQIPLKVTFEHTSPVDLCFETASNSAALDIANKHDNLHLCLSGGMDSEYVASVLIRNKIKFTPVVCLINKISKIEAWWAFHFCKQHNIVPLVFDYSTSIDQLIKLMLNHSLRLKSPLNLGFLPNAIADLIGGGKLITGGGALLHNSKSYSEPLGDILEIEEHDYYFDIINPTHPGAFFTYTPNMFFSMIYSIDRTVNSQVAKSKLYNVPFRSKVHSTLEKNTPKYLLPLTSQFKKSDSDKCLKLDYHQTLALAHVNK